MDKQNDTRAGQSFERTLRVSLPDCRETRAQLVIVQEPRVVKRAYTPKPEDEIVTVKGKDILTTPSVVLWLSCPDVTGRHLLEADLHTETDANWLLRKTIDGIKDGEETCVKNYIPSPEDLAALRTTRNLLFDTLGGIAANAQ